MKDDDKLAILKHIIQQGWPKTIRSSIQDTTLLDLLRQTYNRRQVNIKRHKDHHTRQEKGRYSEINT